MGAAVFCLNSPDLSKYEINFKKGRSALHFTFLPATDSIEKQQEYLPEEWRKKFEDEIAEDSEKINKQVEREELKNLKITEIIHTKKFIAPLELNIGKIKNLPENKKDIEISRHVLKNKVSENTEKRKEAEFNKKPVEKTVRNESKSKLSSVASRASDMMVKGVETKASAIGQINPRYPRLSRINNEEGNVLIEAEISKQGKCLDAKIIRGSGYNRLDKAALKEVLRAKFTPAKRGHHAVSSKIHLLIKFKLT